MLTLQKWIIDVAMVSAKWLSEIRSLYEMIFLMEAFISGLSPLYMSLEEFVI